MITLATLGQATAQEVFDQVVTHLQAQGAKSIAWNDHNDPIPSDCRYRGDNGLMCAAGCLISDDEYTAEMENRNWAYLLDVYKFSSNHESLISELQVIHDFCDVAIWPDEFALLAKRLGLSYTRPEKVE